MMNIKCERIGQVDLEFGQYDEYWLVKDVNGNDIDLQALDSYMFDKYAYQSEQPGGAFCTMIYSSEHRFLKDRAIVTFCHRLDI